MYNYTEGDYMLATETSFPKIGFDEIDMSYLLDTIPQQEETYDSDQTEEETYEEIIKVYLGKKEVHAKDNYTCAFSGAKISKGSLYVCYRPMIKNITRGEDVCFDFYVVDNVTKDVVDLRKVDALSITLTGNFGCTLGTYTYPSDDGYIRPLQKLEYKHILEEGFKERKRFNLNVVSVDIDLEEISESNINGKIGSYYEGDTVVLEAYDTESYLFVGWIDLDSELDDECDDYYYSTNHRIVFKIYSDDMALINAIFD